MSSTTDNSEFLFANAYRPRPISLFKCSQVPSTSDRSQSHYTPNRILKHLHSLNSQNLHLLPNTNLAHINQLHYSHAHLHSQQPRQSVHRCLRSSKSNKSTLNARPRLDRIGRQSPQSVVCTQPRVTNRRSTLVAVAKENKRALGQTEAKADQLGTALSDVQAVPAEQIARNVLAAKDSAQLLRTCDRKASNATSNVIGCEFDGLDSISFEQSAFVRRQEHKCRSKRRRSRHLAFANAAAPNKPVKRLCTQLIRS